VPSSWEVRFCYLHYVFGALFHRRCVTLPVLFAMLSNHYGFLYSGPRNWLVLVFMMLAGALIRQSFVLRHKALATGRPVPWVYAMVGCAVLLVLVFAVAPRPPAPHSAAASALTFAQVQQVFTQRCVMCHNDQLANKGIKFDSAEMIEKNAQAAYQQAVVLKTMPLNNATQITDAERALLKRWFEAGTKISP